MGPVHTLTEEPHCLCVCLICGSVCSLPSKHVTGMSVPGRACVSCTQSGGWDLGSRPSCLRSRWTRGLCPGLFTLLPTPRVGEQRIPGKARGWLGLQSWPRCPHPTRSQSEEGKGRGVYFPPAGESLLRAQGSQPHPGLRIGGRPTTARRSAHLRADPQPHTENTGWQMNTQRLHLGRPGLGTLTCSQLHQMTCHDKVSSPTHGHRAGPR